MNASPGLSRRALLRAIACSGAALASAPDRSVAGPLVTDLRAPEPIAQLHAMADGALLAVSAGGVLWRHDSGSWKRIGEGLSPAAPLAVGHGRIAGRSERGGLWVLESGGVTISDGAVLAPHAGLQVLAFGIIAIADDAGAGRVIRLDPGERGRWSESARGAEAVLPDARPLQIDLDAQQLAPDAGHIVVLAGPDDRRYRHGILGDAIEATRVLYLERHSLDVLRSLDVPPPHVFEDIAPQPIAWRGGVGLLTVRSGPLGAQLAVLGRSARSAQALETVALGAPLGTANRWMVPLSDGANLFAVHTPHIGGVLHAYRAGSDGALSSRVVATDCSTHVIGRREMGLAVWLGRDLALPDQSRRRIRVLARDLDWRERRAVDLPAPLASMRALTRNGRSSAAMLLDDGRVALLEA